MFWVRCIGQKLTNDGRQPINTVYDYLQLFVVVGIIPGDIGCTGEDGGQEAEVEVALFLDRPVPVLVVTKWT
jgi:hypothetical protein